MTASLLGVPSSVIAATTLPEGYEPEAVFLRSFILNSRDAVKANQLKRKAMLEDAIRQLVAESMKEVENTLVHQLSNWLDEQAASEGGIDVAEALFDPEDVELLDDTDLHDLEQSDGPLH